MSLKRTSAKWILFFLIVIISLPAPLAVASEKMTLTVGSKFPKTYPLCQGLLKMGELIEKETNGKITFQYFFNEKLGKKQKIFKMIQKGQSESHKFKPLNRGAYASEIKKYEAANCHLRSHLSCTDFMRAGWGGFKIFRQPAGLC